MNTLEAISLFLQSRQAKGLSAMTMRWYRGTLGGFALKFKKLPKRPEPIEEFLISLPVGDERRHGYYRAIRALYRWLHKRRKIANPIDLIDPPKRSPKQRGFLTPDQIDQLISFPHIPVIKACLIFLVDTGCRISELASISREEFVETPWGWIVKVKGKTGERYLPVSTEVYNAIVGYLPLPFTPYRLRIKIARAFKDAHIGGSSLTLRHTFGTLWEGDELVLQRIMGHSSLQTTKIYRQPRIELMARQHHRFSPLNMVFAWSKSML